MPDGERAPTGIYGLDELIEGGFPRRRTLLLSGACGTGKSIFSMQFLYRGLLEYNEPGVFVTFDEAPENIRSDMLRFGWNLPELEKNGLFTIVDAASGKAGQPSHEENSINDQKDFDKLMIDIIGSCRKIGAKRLVIDSIPAMGFQYANETIVRQNILRMAYILNRSGLTTLLTTEIPEQSIGSGSMSFSKYGVEEYIADGVIVLSFIGSGEASTRTAYIRKMRGTNHSLAVHPLEITEKGIVIKKIEDVFK